MIPIYSADPLQLLTRDVISKCQSINKAHKAHLESARHLFYYFEALTTSPNIELVHTLINALHDCSNQEGERKIFRVYFLLLKEIFISSYSQLTTEHSSYLEQLKLETYSMNVMRQGLAWKTMGILLQHKLFENHLRAEDIHDALCKLSFPVKAKKTLFSSTDDSEYPSGLHVWSCIMSAIAHSNTTVPKKCLANVLLGITATHHRLARNSLQVLILAIPSDPVECLKGLHSLLCPKPPDPYAKLKTDPIFMVYVCRAVSIVSRHLTSCLQQVETLIGDIFVALCDMLQSKNKYVLQLGFFLKSQLSPVVRW